MLNESYIKWLEGYAAKRVKLKNNKVTHVVDGGGPDSVYYTQHFLNSIRSLRGHFMVIQTYDHTYLFKADNLIKQPMCRFMILCGFSSQSEFDMIKKIDECEYEAEQIITKIHKEFKEKTLGIVLNSFDLNEVNVEKLFLGDNKCGVGVTFPLKITHNSMLTLDNDWE